MGAYSNPEAYIDTQSGQHYRNLQETITNATIGTLNTIAAKAEENKKKVEALQAKVGEEESILYKNLSSVQQTNPTVNFEELYRPAIKKYAELRTRVLNGTSTDPSADREEAAKIYASVTTVKDSLVDLGSEGFLDKYAKMDAPEGYSSKFSDANTMKSMLIFSNKLPGKKVGRFADGDYSKFVWDIYDNEGNLIQTMSAEQLKKASSGQGLLKTVPNAADAVDNTKLAAQNIFDAKDNKLLGTVKPEYLDTANIIEKKVGADTVLETAQGRKTIGNYQPSYKVNKELISADQNFNAVTSAKADGMINSSDSGIEAIMFYNTHIAKDDKDLFDPEKPLTPEDKIKFKEAYKKFVLDGIPEFQPAGDIVKREDFAANPKPIKTPKAPKQSAGAAEKEQNKAEAKATLDAAFKNPSKGMIVHSADNKYHATIDADGKWYASDSKGTITSAVPLNERTVKLHLRYNQ